MGGWREVTKHVDNRLVKGCLVVVWCGNDGVRCGAVQRCEGRGGARRGVPHGVARCRVARRVEGEI